MLEVVFLLWVIPRRMTKLARQRKLSALRWSLYATGAWVGAEIGVIFLLVLGSFITFAIWRFPADPEQFSSSPYVYVPGLIAGIVAAELMIRRLSAKPAADEAEAAE